MRAQDLYDEYHRINIIMKGNLQRRIRRAWIAYKERKAEKQRLAALEEEKKKSKRHRRLQQAAMQQSISNAVK